MGVAVGLFLAGAAWFGHAFLLTMALNVWFSIPLPRRLLKRGRLTIAFFVFTFPLVLAWIYGRQLLAAWHDPAALAERPIVLGYLSLCWLTTFVYVPLASVIRSARRNPPQLEVCDGKVEDIAVRLGEKPVGNGKYWRLSTLPRNQCFQVEYRDVTLRLPRLPAAWNGLTILHITDLHFCGSPGRRFYQQVFDLALAGEVPDILAITGDVVDSAYHHKWVVPLIGRLKWNIAAFAVLGNHDKYYEANLIRRRLRRIGVRVLGNGCELIEARGEPMIVVGSETPWFRPGPDLTDCPTEAFRLCLSHTPDNFRWAQRNNIDLMLAGHVHGGQVRLPWIGPLFVPSRYCRRYDCGAFAAGPTVMYVGRGLAGGEPLRYNCHPEVTRIRFAATRSGALG